MRILQAFPALLALAASEPYRFGENVAEMVVELPGKGRYLLVFQFGKTAGKVGYNYVAPVVNHRTQEPAHEAPYPKMETQGKTGQKAENRLDNHHTDGSFLILHNSQI